MKLPAAYTCHNATLASFCSARPTSLVVDLGGSEIRIVPVVDGFSMNRAIVRTCRGGNALDRHLESILQSRQSRKREAGGDGGVDLKPWFQCKGRTCPPGLTESFVQIHRNDVIRDVKHWMCFIPHSRNSDGTSVSTTGHTLGDIMELIPPYELPDGTMVKADEDLCLGIEKQLFPHQLHTSQSKNTRVRRSRGGDSSVCIEVNDEDPLHRLVMHSIDKCDVDVRKELLANIVLVGGGSLLDGLTQRLSNEIPKMVPSNVKVFEMFFLLL
jgi:actin-related protein